MINKTVEKWTEMLHVEPSEDNFKLYLKLIGEEYVELMLAIQDKNLVEIHDALSDLKWVLTGAQIMLGEKPSECDDAVTESNNGKWVYHRDVAEKTVIKYKKQGIETQINTYENSVGKEYYVVTRVPDNKIMKPITWKEPNWSFLTSPEWWDKYSKQ